MDPVNKWLTTIILFMIAFLVVISWKAGSGRYTFAAEKSTLFESYAVVYVLDTRNGDVHAKLVNESDLQNDGVVVRKAQKVFEISPPYYGYKNRGF